MTLISRLGCPKNSADSQASARRASLTTIHGTLTSVDGGASATIADGARGDGLRREDRAVGFQAQQRHEHRAARDPPGVVGDAGAGRVERAAAARAPAIAPVLAPGRARGGVRRRSWLCRARDWSDSRSSLSTTVDADSIGSPAGGYCCTTTPVPCRRAVSPSCASTRSASRALMPVRSGNTVAAADGDPPSGTIRGRVTRARRRLLGTSRRGATA